MGIDGSDSAQAPTAFLEIISDDSPILHTQRSHHAAWVIFHHRSNVLSTNDTKSASSVGKG